MEEMQEVVVETVEPEKAKSKSKKTAIPTTEQPVEQPAEIVEEPVVVEEKKPNKFVAFLKKLKQDIDKKITPTKHDLAVKKEIRKQFHLTAIHYTVLDTFVKGVVKILLEKDAIAKTFTFLGKLNLKEKTLLRDKEGNLFKVVTQVEGEHTRTFEAEGEEHVRELTIYSYQEI